MKNRCYYLHSERRRVLSCAENLIFRDGALKQGVARLRQQPVLRSLHSSSDQRQLHEIRLGCRFLLLTETFSEASPVLESGADK